MFTKSRKSVLIIAVLALVVLTGCTMHGGGVVQFFDVYTGLGDGIPTEASIAISVNCNDNKDAFRTNINVVDNTNNAHINAHLKWTPVSEVASGAETCEEAAEIVEQEGASVAGGILSSQGQENGQVIVVVIQPGAGPADCGDMQTIIVQAEEDTPDRLPGGEYYAAGCLDRGQINF